ncbi:MAG: GIY-YIG nuclease family protein [Pyrinomonadaceae bacterium]
MSDRKDLLQEYKLSHRPMGVFQIRNVTNDKVFVDSSLNIPGKINRHRFTLNAGLFKSKSLQNDWNELGEASFEFETLEPVEPRSDPNYDYAADVQVLEDLWLERLEPFGNVGYNERNLTREERLSMIRANSKL